MVARRFAAGLFSAWALQGKSTEFNLVGNCHHPDRDSGKGRNQGMQQLQSLEVIGPTQDTWGGRRASAGSLPLHSCCPWVRHTQDQRARSCSWWPSWRPPARAHLGWGGPRQTWRGRVGEGQDTQHRGATPDGQWNQTARLTFRPQPSLAVGPRLR